MTSKLPVAIMNPVDAHLDDVTVKTLVWKPGTHRDIAGAIVRVHWRAAGW